MSGKLKQDERKITLVAPNYYDTYQFTMEPGQQYIVGRSDQVSAFYPKVDLSDLGAYRMGVSRMHATLELVDNKLVVVDHSSNGTLVNGERLEKDNQVPVENHSLISFGELNFHILIQQ